MEPNSNLTTNVNPSIDDVFDIVANIVSDKFGIEKDEVKMDTLLEKDLGADGLDIVEFVMTLEAEFGIVLPDEIFIPHELIEDGDECEEDETEDEEWEDEEDGDECEEDETEDEEWEDEEDGDECEEDEAEDEEWDDEECEEDEEDEAEDEEEWDDEEDGDECEEDEAEDEEWEDEEYEEEYEDGEEDVQFEPYTLTIADFVSFIHASLSENSK